jgi:hypothetical protein
VQPKDKGIDSQCLSSAENPKLTVQLKDVKGLTLQPGKVLVARDHLR